MCLLFIAIEARPRYPLVIAANRDEFYDRPTAPLGYWEDAPHVLAGRDGVAGGTWLGITRNGRWAAVTNVREARTVTPEHSRGHLVSDFLRGEKPAEAYADAVLRKGTEYAGFNLVVGDRRAAFHCSNRQPTVTALRSGVYGLSNHVLDTPWPKLVRGKERFARRVRGAGPLDEEALFEVLADRERPPDDALPDTGVGLETERVLSSAFIAVKGYGTRSSTVLTLDRDGQVTMTERRFPPTPKGDRHPDHYDSESLALRLR